MPDCPRCQVPLRTVRQRRGIYFFCDRCQGRAVTIPQVRRVGGDRYATSLLRQINASPAASERRCPFCTRRMRLLASREPSLELDACRPCTAIWFDPSEFEVIPEKGVPSSNDPNQRAAEIIALQALGAYQQLHGVSEISAVAHLGGGMIGLVAWLLWRRAERRPLELDH